MKWPPWFRREPPELLMLRAENKRLIKFSEELEIKLCESNRIRENLNTLIGKLLEPEETQCHKIRLHNRDEAQSFAEHVQRRTQEGELEPYRCPVCPRHPLTMAKYWHIRHVSTHLRGRIRRGPEERPMKVTALGNRLNPTMLDKLNKKMAI